MSNSAGDHGPSQALASFYIFILKAIAELGIASTKLSVTYAFCNPIYSQSEVLEIKAFEYPPLLSAC